MGNPRKKTWIIISIILLIMLFIVALLIVKETPKQNVKIGVILPLTKNFAFMGEGARNAILLAKEQLPNSTKYNYTLVFEDDQLNPVMSATATQKLISIDQVDAIISFTSGTGNVVSPLTEENKIVHIGIASDPNVAKGKYNFIHWTPPSEESKVFFEELQRRNITKIAVMRQNDAGANAIMNAIKNDINKTDVSIVAEESFNSDEKDFRTILLKENQENPEIYLLLAGSYRLDLIAKQMKELGINKPMTSIEMFESAKDPYLFEGMWYVQIADATSKFKDDYINKYGKEPEYGSPNAYDAFNLIMTAFENADKQTSNPKPTSDEVVDTLHNIKGLSGALGALSVSDNNIVLSKAIIKEVRDGKFVVLRQ